MTSKEYLSQYQKINTDIDANLDDLAQLRALAAKVSPSERFSGGGEPTDRVGRTVAKIVDLENRINEEVDRLVDLREEILVEINSLPNAMQRQVLRYRYINGWTWEQIAEKMDCSYQWVCVLHGRGLQSFKKIFGS